MYRLRLFSLLLLPFAILAVSSANVSALSGSQFNAGRIMDDTVFFNGSTMNPTQIQEFLNSKVPSCDTNHAKSSSSNDSGPPYTCLKDYRQNTPARSAESGLCGSLSARTNRTSASIINDVAHACGVSQKVLIVLLQKEQGLVTDTWPWDIQYKKATGFGCPDTAPCNSQYYGFFNQVYMAARQFKKYSRDRDNYNYQAGVRSYVQWNPNAGCGGSNVTMQNQATAGLYNYTPYRPNSAALNNLYGTGDSCSSYGNRNFWRYYSDWFGTTLSSPFFRINGGDTIYVLGSENNYYKVDSPKVLSSYGYSTSGNDVVSVNSAYVSGKSFSGILPLVTHFEGDEIYLLDEGKLHYFSSTALMTQHGFAAEDAAQLPAWMKTYYSSGWDMQQEVQVDGSDNIYNVESSKKRLITSYKAFTTTGSPTYSSRVLVKLSSFYLSRFPDGVPIVANNVMLKKTNGTYGFWNGSQLQAIVPSVASDLGIVPDYTGPASIIDQLPSGGSLVSKLAKNSSNQLFILDTRKKFLVQNSDLANLGLSSGSFITASDNMLSQVTSEDMSVVVKYGNYPPVYFIKSGLRLYVPDRKALTENGHDISQAKSVNHSTASLFPMSSHLLLPTGTIYRIGSTDTIYLINGIGSSLKVPSRAVLQEFGYSLNSVQSFSSSQVGEYPSAGYLNYFVKDSTNQVWLVQSGNTKHTVSGTMYDSSHFNINPSAIFQVSSAILNRYSTGAQLTEVVKASNSSKVYKIQNGQKRWITSMSAFTTAGYTASDITTLSPSYLSTVPSGSNIN